MEEPTASPLFPKDLATLVTLGPDQVRMLVREYGLGGDAGDEEEDDGDDEVISEDPEAWSVEVHFTNANYQAKKMTLLLFINRE